MGAEGVGAQVVLGRVLWMTKSNHLVELLVYKVVLRKKMKNRLANKAR